MGKVPEKWGGRGMPTDGAVPVGKDEQNTSPHWIE